MLLSQDRCGDFCRGRQRLQRGLAVGDQVFYPARPVLSPASSTRWASPGCVTISNQLTTTSPALAERLQAATEALRDNIREAVFTGVVALRSRGSRKPPQTKSCANAPLSRIEPRQIEQMRALIARSPRRLRERYSKPRKRQRRGISTCAGPSAATLAWGGVPFLTAWKRRRRDRPRIVALCDVSGSVARVSDFFLLLIHSLHDGGLGRAFVRVLGASDRGQRDPGIERRGRGDGRDHVQRSASARPIMADRSPDFERQMMESVTPQTTVIVLGDARGNNLDPGADIVRRIAERSKRSGLGSIRRVA